MPSLCFTTPSQLGWLYADVTADPQRASRPKYYVTYTGKPHQSNRDFDIYPDAAKRPGWKVHSPSQDEDDLGTYQRKNKIAKVARTISKELKRCVEEKLALLEQAEGGDIGMKTARHVINVSDILTLRPKKWLTGTIINAYLRILSKSIQKTQPDTLILPTDFWAFLTKRNMNKRTRPDRRLACNYARVKDWLIQARVRSVYLHYVVKYFSL